MDKHEHCQFYLERKQRYCRMTVKKGRSFCGEHQINDGSLNKIVDERINCPLDPSQHKRDNKLKDQEDEIRTLRVRADIADLKLDKVPEMSEIPSKVGIAKHLCGAATDLTLRCMTDSIQHCATSEIGIVIAFCCHHRCEYAHYVGHKFLEAQGFTKDDFPILCKLASWATCGIKQNNRTDSDRELIGRKVKTLLNWGRVEYLKDLGFDCRVVHYTTTDVTLENECIVAKFIRKNEPKPSQL
ncbi:hypothetical protein QAD02_009648 [Eretmocerus hayati]|uniref:Uncharacterized protein n=1 Tax=Eretmocerus hayati TaxID=131215 RepID=A0ACC2NA02_9HYME|nr:hypothetical protein QAD02_009648 [Eretmocerus hayati]